MDLYAESSDNQVADQVPDLHPQENGNFRFILIDSYSQSSEHVADQVPDLLVRK